MRKIYKLTLNDFISTVAIQAFDVYTIWYIAQVTQDQHLIALFGSVGIFNIILSPIGGAYSDSYSKARIIQITSYLKTCLFGLLLVYLLINNQKVNYSIIVVSAILSIVNAFYTPAIESIVPEISTDENDLFKNNTFISMAGQIASLAGAGIGSLLIIIFYPTLSYLAVFGITLISSIFVIKLGATKTESHQKQTVKLLAFKHIFKGFKVIWSIDIIKILFPYACLMNLSYWLYYYLMPIYLSKEFPTFKFAYSLQEFTIALAAFICGVYLTKFSDYIVKYSKLYVPFLLAQSIGIVLMPLLFMITNNEVVKLVILLGAWLLYGVFNFLSSLIFVTKIQQLVDGSKLGTTFGIIFSIFGALSPISAGLSGLIKEINSIAVFLVGSIMILTVGVMLFDKRIKGLFVAKTE